ncbi:tRNA pseudouridine(38-40) synthase TruA [Nibricoccus sp. IMCC34717]|uniref:tRNA pseudouridine(38-40) synthase TruA n=1 Tax=Nibricoccus sp. IMCC34717 TaxID=3034021 RepID=UPI003850ED83
MSAGQRWCCVCAYDGGPFSGWQSQPGGNAIQDVLERRLAAVFKKQIRIHGSGRTDSGVHARGQVFHFDAAWPHGPDKLRLALRIGLPREIQIRSIARVGAGFHARFDVSGKRYRYHLHLGDADPFTRPYAWVYERPLDLEAMAAAARLLQGRHDFAPFSALNGKPKADTVRDLRVLRLLKRGRRLVIEAEADGFLYKMVRSLVGALVSVGEGKLALAEIEALLAGGRRPAAVFTAPPEGLFLERVYYPVGAKKKRTRKDALENQQEQESD